MAERRGEEVEGRMSEGCGGKWGVVLRLYRRIGYSMVAVDEPRNRYPSLRIKEMPIICIISKVSPRSI